MMLSLAEQIVLIALAALGVMLTRFLPFLLFSPNRPTPPLIRYLAKCLAPAVFGLLMVYCFRSPLAGGPHGLPMLLATAVTAAVQAFTRKMTLALLVGTGMYTVLLTCADL